MGHANNIELNGEKIPSVTEVLGIVAKPFIHEWYKREVYKAGLDGWKKCEQAFEDGCNFGTAVHNALENWDLSNPAAQMIYTQFCPKVAEFVHQEQHLTSKLFRYHGTTDAIVRMEGETGLYVLDWKTSNSDSIWYVVQMAAYAQAWNEDHPDQMIDKAICVHYDKKLKTPKLKITEYRGLKHYFKAFEACRAVMDYDRQTGPWNQSNEGV